jgi:drug/metabolite transporter (DMT)-like permease
MFSSFLSRAYGSAPLLLCLATLGWGGNTIAGRFAVGEVSPMLLLFLRWGLAMVVIILIYHKDMRTHLPIMRRHWRWTLMMGGVGMTGFNALIYTAAHSTTAINLGVIQGTMPGMILLGSFLIFGTKINLKQSLGLLVTLVGVVVVVSGGSPVTMMGMSFNFGDILMLVACVFYSGYAIGLRNRPQIPSTALIGFFSIAAFITSIPMLAIEAVSTGVLMPSTEGWVVVLYAAAVPSFLSQVFFTRGVDLIGPGPAGLYTNLVPVYGAILAVFLLSESLEIFHLVALSLVFGGIYLFRTQKPEAR